MLPSLLVLAVFILMLFLIAQHFTKKIDFLKQKLQDLEEKVENNSKLISENRILIETNKADIKTNQQKLEEIEWIIYTY